MSSPQRVLVTAGASGIGLAIARAFAANGARVHVCDVDTAALAQLAHDGMPFSRSVCDVADPVAVTQMVDEAVASLGGLDVLIDNAGIAGPTAPAEALDPVAWQQVIDVNLTGTFNVTRHAIAHLKRSAAGVIVVLSSVAGRFGYANRIAYATSKWGLIGFTKTLAIELGPYGIRVNAILPGTVEGPRLARVFEGRAQASGRTVEEEAAAAMANQSIARLVDPADVAALAVFLASDHAKSISGQMLPIDNDMQRL
jgi:NAD(P)-dependent dehydrogenase (short-subunit alcohol dehydrogenase family)